MTHYPIEITPTPGHSHKMDISSMIADGLRLIVVRRSDRAVQYNDRGWITEACLSEYDFQYSMNLLGGAFRVPDHLKLRQSGRGVDNWDGATFLTQDEMDCSYEEVEAHPIYYDVRALHKKTIPYEKNMPHRKNFYGKSQSEIGSAIEAGKAGWGEAQVIGKFNAVLEVVHEPSLMNYWHVTLRAYEDNTSHDVITKGKGAWRKIVRNAVYELLQKYYIGDDNIRCDTIPDKYYVSTP